MADKMKKSLIISLGIIALILFSGCTGTIVTNSMLVKIEDTGSNISNYESCYNEGMAICNNNRNCVGISLDIEDIMCEGGYCIC